MLVEASLEHLGKTAIEAKSGTLLYNIYFLLRFSSKSQILLYRISLDYIINNTPNSQCVSTFNKQLRLQDNRCKRRQDQVDFSTKQGNISFNEDMQVVTHFEFDSHPVNSPNEQASKAEMIQFT